MGFGQTKSGKFKVNYKYINQIVPGKYILLYK